MKVKAPQNRKATDLVIALVFALCILIVAFIYRAPGYVAMSPSINPFFVLQPESVAEEPIDGYAGVKRIYRFDLSKQPLLGKRGQTLYVYLRHTAAVLTLDGQVRYSTAETDTPHIGHTPGNSWMTLPVLEEYSGSVMEVELIPVYESVRDEQPMFLVIDRQPLITMMLLPREGLQLVLGGIAVVTGLFLSILSLFIGLGAQDRPRVFYLGAVTAAAGLWKLCGLSVVPLLLDHLGWFKEIWYLGAVSYLLMMVLSLRLLSVIQPDGTTKAGRLSCIAAGLAAAVILCLQMANVLELHEVLVPYGVGVALLHLGAMFGQKPLRAKLLWVAPTLLALGADLLLYQRAGSISTAPVFLIWILFNLFVRGVLFLRGSLKREKALHEARVRSMMSQIRPHFIYNTLVTIRSLCRSDQQRAGSALEDFTEYLQANFTAVAMTEPIPFEDELKHTKAYLSVEAMLYEENLQVVCDTPHTAFHLPALTLQPIVENAVKHSSAASRQSEQHPPIRITIRTRETDGFHEFTVEDNGGGFAPDAMNDEAPHTGLQNVRERLMLMCGGTLEITSTSEGSVVTVRIPK